MKKVILITATAVLFFILGYFISGTIDKEEYTVKRTQILMGTIVEIQIRGTDREEGERLVSEAFEEIARVDSVFSTYIETSPIYKINNSGAENLKVNDEIYNFIIYSDSIWKVTGGAYDAALNRLAEVWGFDSGADSLPGESIVKEALLQSGWGNIKIYGRNTISRNGAEFNFGAAAKGYAVDKAYELLISKGAEKALINAGGEIRVIGKDWVVGVQDPREEGKIAVKLKLSNMAAATSGDYERYFIHGGKRYHHILNPKTGYPAGGAQSVTVIAENDRDADAFSTAVFVMGVKQGLEFINEIENTEAMIIDSAGNYHYSKGFEKFILE